MEAEIREPAEIVAELHRAIAKRSPEHAALVAAFEELTAGKRRAEPGDGRETGGYARGQQVSADCRARMRRYLGLRQTMSMVQAAAAMGIHPETARRYDRECWLVPEVSRP